MRLSAIWLCEAGGDPKRAASIQADLRAGEMTFGAIARKHGVSVPAVGKWARKLGIEAKRPAPAAPRPPTDPMGSPAYRAKASARNRELWAKPQYRAQQLSSRNTPEYKQQQAKSTAGVWNKRGGFWNWLLTLPPESRQRTLVGLVGKKIREKELNQEDSQLFLARAIAKLRRLESKVNT